MGRSSPHECLSVGADLGDDGTKLGFETHVEHPVRLVQHQVGDPAQVGHAFQKREP